MGPCESSLLGALEVTVCDLRLKPDAKDGGAFEEAVRTRQPHICIWKRATETRNRTPTDVA